MGGGCDFPPEMLSSRSTKHRAGNITGADGERNHARARHPDNRRAGGGPHHRPFVCRRRGGQDSRELGGCAVRLDTAPSGKARADEEQRQDLRFRGVAVPGDAFGHHCTCQRRDRARQSRFFLARTGDPERRARGFAHCGGPVQGRDERPLQQRVPCSRTAPSARSRISKAGSSRPTPPEAQSTSPCGRCCASTGSRTGATIPWSRRRSPP